MSGPKVVRVISREEKQRTVKKHQTKVLFALNKLRQFANENQQLTDQLKSTLEQRQAQFEAYNESDFESIESIANKHVGFLSALQEEVENELVEKKQQHKRRIRQIKMASTSLQLAFQQRQQKAPERLALLTTLSVDTKLEQLQQHEKVLQMAFELLSQHPLSATNSPLSDELLSLQSRLSTNESIKPLEDWINTQKPIINKQQERLDKLLSRLELMNVSANQQSERQSFVDRAETLEQSRSSTSDSQYALQLDSLLLDVSQFTQQQQILQHLTESLEQALNTILESSIVTDTEQAALVLSIQATLSAPKTTQAVLEKQLEEAQVFILTQEKELTSQSRRQAVLKSLSKLGYQVTEGMSTAWVEDGRLVVRKASSVDYGIELTTNPEMQRLQARVVVNREASQRSADSDTQAEEVWCGDFSSLKEIIHAQNGELIVDKALPIGSQKLKELEFKNQGDEERARQYIHQQNQLQSKSK